MNTFYLTIVKEDGTAVTIMFRNDDSAENAFKNAIKLRSVTFAQYGELFGVPIDRFAREL